MAYFRCTTGGSGKGNTLVVTCADDLAGATITCTNGTKTYTKTCPSTAPYEVTFYGLVAGTWTVSATVSGNTYTTTVVVTDYEAELGGFNWKTWVDLSKNYTSSDFTDLDDLLDTELAVRELMSIHACVDYLAGIAAESADVETIIGNDLCAKWINNRDYALDTLYANEIIAGYMDTADKYGYGELVLLAKVPKVSSSVSEVVYSSQLNTTEAAWKAFDEDIDTTWSANGSTDEYVGYHFSSAVKLNSAKIIRRYLTGYGEATETCVIKASNDGTNWVEVSDEFTHSLNTTTAGTYDIVNINTDVVYSYYALFVKSINSQNVKPFCAELQFYAYAPKGNVPIMTSNTAPYGEASASVVPYSSHPAWHAFDGNSSTAYSAGNTANAILSYKFSNPVCVKRVLFDTDKSANYSASIKTWDIIAKNDASANWEIIYSGSNDDVKIVEQEISCNQYYLYWGIKIKTSYRSESYALDTLQFYGRELSVSVPKMDTNTTPYGEAFSSSNTYSANPAYLAFDKDFSTYWGTSSTTAGQIGYKFPSKMVLKKFHLDMTYYGIPYTCQVKGSNDGTTYFNIGDSFVVDSGTKDVDYASNNTEYKYIRLDISVGTTMGIVAESLQFYGLDYSEKEFEEGTTKKWLYDHGVELETVYISAKNAVKEDSYLKMHALVNQGADIYSGFCIGSINLTDYSLVMCKVGKELKNDSTISPRAGQVNICNYNVTNGVPVTSSNIKANKNCVAPISDTNLSLDISSINESLYVCVGDSNAQSNGNIFTITELWLE